MKSIVIINFQYEGNDALHLYDNSFGKTRMSFNIYNLYMRKAIMPVINVIF